MSIGCVSIFFFALGAAAQTVTTNGGATNTIPKFSSSTQIVNSSLSETNGNLTIPDNAYITDFDGLFYSGNLNLTTSCCTIDATHAGYGAWLNYNAFFNGSNWIQARGDLNSYMFTTNFHGGGWGWYTAAPTGTNGSTITPVNVASLDSSGNLNNAGKIRVGGGVDATGGGIKHARAGGCSASTASCSVTVSWPGSAFADTNYTAVCTPDNANQGVFSITSKTTSNVTVTIKPISVTVAVGTATGGGSSFNVSMSGVECMAMHD
jgi:hypothetical protein